MLCKSHQPTHLSPDECFNMKALLTGLIWTERAKGGLIHTITAAGSHITPVGGVVSWDGCYGGQGPHGWSFPSAVACGSCAEHRQSLHVPTCCHSEVNQVGSQEQSQELANTELVSQWDLFHQVFRQMMDFMINNMPLLIILQSINLTLSELKG